MTPPLAPWKLEKHVGHLALGPLAGRVQIEGGVVSFRLDAWQGRPQDRFDVFVLGAPLAQWKLEEAYVRGSDLVATYAKTPPYHVAPQAYWRATWIAEWEAVKLELVLSVQTDLLDSQPRCTIESGGQATSLWMAGEFDGSAFREWSTAAPTSAGAGDASPQLYVLRNEQAGFSYAELVHPMDFVAASIDADLGTTGGIFSVRSTLFPERLEKGVIRRARVGGWFLPLENDLAAAAALAQAFVGEPLPLTT
ncbi:MAG: hypothetical protein MUF06_06095 [Pirellulaceae bacterium]|nr:hypothetical protein [Pirellulaceae bacterium]